MTTRTIVRPIVSAIVRGIVPAPPAPPTPLGPDLAVNGGFTTDTDWTLGGGWAITPGAGTLGFLYRIEVGASSMAQQASALLLPGSIYRMRFTVRSVSGSDNRLIGRIFGASTVSGPIRTGPGVYEHDIAAPASPAGYGIFAVGGFAGVIDSFSIREVNPGT